MLLYVILALIILYLLAIMPRMLNRPDYRPLKGWHYAHRGLHDNHTQAPENSMAAFRKAVDGGYGIELDVQLTGDDVPVVFHDETLKRVCGGEGNVRDYTYEQLKQFYLCESQQQIPRFADVLRLVNGKTPLIVEIKMYASSTKVCELADALLREYTGTYCIESFHPSAVLWYKKNHSEIIRGQLSSNFKKESGKETVSHFVVHHLLTNFITKPDFIAFCCKYKDSLSRKICKYLFRSLSVAWTIRSQKELDMCKNDFDLFIFEGFLPHK